MRIDRLVSYTATILALAFGLSFLLLAIVPVLSQPDYSPEGDGLGMPFGLFFIYLGLFNLRLTHPRMPWIGKPGFSQGCAVSWIGLFVLSTVLAGIGALLGRHAFDAGSIAWIWTLFVGVPFGLAWIVRRIRGRPNDDGRDSA